MKESAALEGRRRTAGAKQRGKRNELLRREKGRIEFVEGRKHGIGHPRSKMKAVRWNKDRRAEDRESGVKRE